MKVYRVTKCEYIYDLSGEGSYQVGGRWSSKGNRIVHTSETASLAILESTVHGIQPGTSYCLATLNIPDDSIFALPATDLPSDWKASPPPESLKSHGDNFVEKRKFLVLKVPSAVNPTEYDYLINPLHPDAHKMNIISTEPFPIDNRLIKKTSFHR